MGVNNLPKVFTRQRAAGNPTRSRRVASRTP